MLMLSTVTAPLKVIVIIMGTWVISRLPGIWVPSGEQKHSGRVHAARSHFGAPLGSSSTPQEFSSEPSLQSICLSQNTVWERHSPSAHCRYPSWQTGSEVLKFGLASLGLVSLSQFSTLVAQSHTWPSRSKRRPVGHRTAARVCPPMKSFETHRTTSLQLDSVDRRKYSLGGLFLHNSWITVL